MATQRFIKVEVYLCCANMVAVSIYINCVVGHRLILISGESFKLPPCQIEQCLKQKRFLAYYGSDPFKGLYRKSCSSCQPVGQLSRSHADFPCKIFFQDFVFCAVFIDCILHRIMHFCCHLVHKNINKQARGNTIYIHLCILTTIRKKSDLTYNFCPLKKAPKVS